jgi:hypothetical protein
MGENNFIAGSHRERENVYFLLTHSAQSAKTAFTVSLFFFSSPTGDASLSFQTSERSSADLTQPFNHLDWK